MAIEDALTLTALLTMDVTAEEIQEHLELYEDIRKPRVAKVRETSRILARGTDNKELQAQYRQFLASHDTVAHANEALARHLEAKS